MWHKSQFCFISFDVVKTYNQAGLFPFVPSGAYNDRSLQTWRSWKCIQTWTLWMHPTCRHLTWPLLWFTLCWLDDFACFAMRTKGIVCLDPELLPFCIDHDHVVSSIVCVVVSLVPLCVGKGLGYAESLFFPLTSFSFCWCQSLCTPLRKNA